MKLFSQSLTKQANALLKPLGIKITKTDKKVIELQEYVNLIKGFHACYSQLNGLDFPPNEKRFDFMADLIGTGIGEAIYILTYLHKAMKVDGDVCEFGVAQGATSAFLANELSSTDKNLWLFDSFQGLPKPSDKDHLIDDVFNLGSIEAYQGAMRCSMDEVRNRLRLVTIQPSQVKIVPGFIEQTIKNDKLPKKVCFAYLDFDFYEPIRTVLDFLSERLSARGVVIVDDYGYFSSGAKAAVDEFMAGHGDDFQIVLPEEWAGNFAVLIKKN